MTRHEAMVLGLVAASILAVGSAAADEVTLNVPVQVSNMASSVTRGRVECVVTVHYVGTAVGGAGVASRKGGPTMQGGRSAEFALDASGAYSGTVPVRVQIGPPRAMLDSGEAITIQGTPEYLCQLQVAMPGSSFYPEMAPRDLATGQATGRGVAPEWARPRAGSNPVVTGRLQVSR